MNNVVRAPPAPAHVEEPTPKPTDKPAVDLPAATVIAPAAVAGVGAAAATAAAVGGNKETVVPHGSGARPEDITARKEEVSKGAAAAVGRLTLREPLTTDAQSDVDGSYRRGDRC